jgi:hypothetical protein
MSPRSKKEYIEVTSLRYKKASRKRKPAILDEFCAICQCHRKHAIRVLYVFGVRPKLLRFSFALFKNQIIFRSIPRCHYSSLISGFFHSEKGTRARLFHPPVEGKLIRGFKGLDVGDRVRIELIGTDAGRRFINFVRAGRRYNPNSSVLPSQL